jgi:hypothetical protein
MIYMVVGAAVSAHDGAFVHAHREDITRAALAQTSAALVEVAVGSVVITAAFSEDESPPSELLRRG